ncbi:MAG: hypothetical protein KDC80_03160 [Saprospiraceae bacterium]|nr:hypothetical protein [Saprospiraceae bacterium]
MKGFNLVVWLFIFNYSCSKPWSIDYHQISEGWEELPDSTRPWVYWYWISDHISREGITRDLEMMDSLGIGAALIGNVFIPNIKRGTVPVLSDEWYGDLRFALQEGSRLGIDIGIFNGPGWVQSGGPWIDSSMAMRYLVCRDTIFSGGDLVNASKLEIREGQQVALFAYPLKGHQTIPKIIQVQSNLKATDDPGNLLDGKLETAYLFPAGQMENEKLVVDLEFEDTISLESVKFILVEDPFYVEFDLEVWKTDDFQKVCSGQIDRSNQMLTVGPMTFGPVVKSFEKTNGKKWRITFQHLNKNRVWFTDVKRNGGIKEILFSRKDRLEHYVEKQLGKMFQLPGPEWEHYQWEEQISNTDTTDHLHPDQWVDLSNLLEKPNQNWTVPDGYWKIYSVAMMPTGVTNAPVSKEAQGLDVDKMKKEYVFYHFENYVRPLLQRLNAEEKNALKYLVIDSYETGSQNWTDGMRAIFLEKYGYDPMPWLPVINGDVVSNPELSDRFLWDVRRMVADEISDEYVAGLQEKAEENQMKLWVENYGHWGFPGEFLQYGGRADLISGEFWLDDPLGEIECRAAASAAHTYGKGPVYAEAFTAPRKHYSRYPGMLRRRGDWSYIQGINHHVLHVYIHQPYQDTFPGINTWFGVEFNRHNSWFPKSKSWIDYLRRNHFLLQQGNYQADVCYFIGEGAPLMTGIEQPGLRPGYAFDFINAEVIINDLEVVDHRLVLPNGMSYALMVLPPLQTMRPELLKKLEQLVGDGAYILGPPPARSPSLKNYPDADREVRELSQKLWGLTENDTHNYGAGAVFRSQDLESVFQYIRLDPDVIMEQKLSDSLLWIHRRRGEVDIYFLTNQSEQLIKANIDFRVQEKYPGLWDAVSGERRPLVDFRTERDRTQIELQFNPGASYFVVFSSNASRETGANFPEYEEVLDLSVGWTIEFDPALEGPEKPLFINELFDWSDAQADSIRYFSGTAKYQKEFEWVPETGESYYLSLGEVAWVANVTLNGKDIGGVWTEPASIKLRGLSSGKNKLEIEVTNTWVNRLIGDSKLPPQERLTWIAENPYRPDHGLQKSGLLGPVKLMKRSH